ncbi:MAG: tetratricopeptide repeat protein [Deltaproteobacteria bacterium]|nr:tetratricopeptide repeat protein [Deltaproteobacteria bacterium]
MGFLDSIKKAFSSQEDEDRASLSRKVQTAPNDPQARQKLGIFLMRAGEVVEGLDQLARAAVIYEKDGFASKAVAVLRQMLKHDPKNNDFQKWLIRLLAAEGLSADAQTELRKISGETGRFTSDEQRLEFFRQMAEYMRGNPLPHLYIADIYRGQKKMMEAVTELTKAVRATVASGMYAEFTERLRAVANHADKDPSILEPCGFLWISVGMPDEGIPILTRVIRQEEEFGHKDRVAEMGEILKEIRAGWNPSELEAYSFAEVARKRAEAASVPAEPIPPPKAEAPPEPTPKAEKEAEEPNDESDIVRDALGRLQAKVHEEIGDSDLETRYNLGIAYKEMGLHEEAVKEFRMAMKKPELVVGASSMLADTLSETGDVEGAIEVLDQALAGEAITKEQHRDLRYHKAVLFSRGGREKEAGEIFVALAEEFPGYRDIDARAKQYRS